VIRIGLFKELNCGDRGPSFVKAASDAVHAVHDLSIGAKNHRAREINLTHSLHVPHEYSHSCRRTICSEPVNRVKIAKGLEGNVDDWKIRGQLDEAVNVPGVIPVFAGSKVVLLSHRTHYGKHASLLETAVVGRSDSVLLSEMRNLIERKYSWDYCRFRHVPNVGKDEARMSSLQRRNDV
jgi:hypothetical protein